MTIAIIVVLTIVLILFIVPCYSNINMDKTFIGTYKQVDLSNIKFRNGDILLFRYNFTAGNIDANQTFTFNKSQTSADVVITAVDTYIYSVPFNHIGIIVIINNVTYILELSVTDLHCAYENKVLRYKPTIIPFNNIKNTYGVVGMIPYIGDDISEKVINNVLLEKKSYTHARHSAYVMLENLLKYVGTNDYTDDPPEFINCGQYIFIVLKKMNIFSKHQSGINILTVTPEDIFKECMINSKYGDFVIIKNDYVKSF